MELQGCAEIPKVVVCCSQVLKDDCFFAPVSSVSLAEWQSFFKALSCQGEDFELGKAQSNVVVKFSCEIRGKKVRQRTEYIEEYLNQIETLKSNPIFALITCEQVEPKSPIFQFPKVYWFEIIKKYARE